MALYENTADQLIEFTLDSVLGDLWEGTATGGTNGTMADTSRYESDDFFQSLTPPARIYIRTTTDAAAPIGESRESTDWVQTGGTLTFLPVMTAVVGAGDTYAISSEYTWAEVKRAINLAIDDAARDMLIEKLDESTELVSSVYEYDVPTGFVYVYRVTMEDGSGNYPSPIPPDQYRIVRGKPTPRLHLSRMRNEQQYQGHWYGELWASADLTAARSLRIEGLARQPKLVLDTDLCYLNPVFVCYKAGELLHARRVRRSDNDPDEHQTQMVICRNIAEGARALTKLPADSKRVEV